ncbi:hypothetical protein MYOV003v1_p0089 [Vibrio phage 207E48.1]|nr:hypothetical protein MYOV003v1_p0089 [Vibrio phage 207E48.1]
MGKFKDFLQEECSAPAGSTTSDVAGNVSHELDKKKKKEPVKENDGAQPLTGE